MDRDTRKLTNMIWRSMGEFMILGVVLLGIILYVLYTYQYLKPFTSWVSGIQHSAMLIGITLLLAGGFGIWYSSKIKRRLEQLHDSMLWLEKGNLSRDVPPLGEDEIGRLGEQLNKITRKWEEQVDSLQRLSTNNAELTEQVRFSAVTEERQRLARELHDAVSQQLFAISMTATALGRTLEKDFDKAKRQVSLIEEMASVAQSEMRALLLHLRPVHLEGKRLSQGLQELLLELKTKVPIDISFDMDESIQLSKGIEDHLFRIVQEALSNTLRHSKADKLEVRLNQRNETVRLSVKDNGIGFDLDQQKHTSYGLVSMKERVIEVGGDLNIITAPGKGTRIDIRVPLVQKIVEEGDSDERGQSDQSTSGG